MSKKRVNIIFVLCLYACLFSSCNAYKKLPYLTNLETEQQVALMAHQGVHEPQVKPNDLLTITVNSSIPGAANDFNLPVVPSVYNPVLQANLTSGGGASSGGAASLQDYLVDKSGNIQFPVFGELKVSGKTVTQLQNELVDRIYPQYIKEKPIVTIRFKNFGVSVLGEVAAPGKYTSENGVMTIFDALAAAGDLTIYGKRDNVLLMRTTEQGDVLTYRINLQDKNSVANPEVFYLQQNDKLYVETNKAKGNNAQFGTMQTISLSVISLVLSVATFLTR